MKEREFSEVSNNQASVTGKISELNDCKLDKDNFYETIISLKRGSGYKDKIPVIIPKEKIILPKEEYIGKIIKVTGQIRSERYNEHILIYIFAYDVKIEDTYSVSTNNSITLVGYLAKKAKFRITPSQREISELFIIAKRDTGKWTDYIPAICWKDLAKFSVLYTTNEKLRFQGRIQSRTYQKECDGKIETKTAYEVSVKSIIRE